MITPTQRHEAGRIIYKWIQSLFPPWDDLDTDRMTQHEHMGSGLRRKVYDLVDSLVPVLTGKPAGARYPNRLDLRRASFVVGAKWARPGVSLREAIERSIKVYPEVEELEDGEGSL